MPAAATRLTDGQAHAAVMGEWLSDAGASFVAEPILALFDAPRVLGLRIPVQPASPQRPPAGGDPKVAINEAQAGYDRFLSTAGRYHGDVLEQANRILRSLDAAAEESLRLAQTSLMGPLATEMAALADNRRHLEESIVTAEAVLNTQATATRRQIDGTAFAARHRVDQAAADASARLPGVRIDLVQRFTKMYEDGAKETTDSGTLASTQLKSDEKKKQVAASFKDVSQADVAAMQEARRLGVPPNLDALAESRMRNATSLAQQIQTRFTQVGVVGGQSVSQVVDGFIANIRMSIEGGEAAGQHIESLRDSGHKAVHRAESQTLSALRQQIQAARETLHHARTNGEAQLASQRSAAFARLSQIRHAAIEGIRDTRSRASHNLFAAANAALATYGDSARRLAQTLQQAAAHGPAALSETAREVFANVAKTLADGQKVQMHRLAEVDEGARGNIRQIAAGGSLQVGDAAAEFDRSLGEQISGLLAEVTGTVRQQTKGLTTMASGVAAAAESYIQQHSRACSQAIDKEKSNLDPTYQAEQGNISKAVAVQTAADKKTVDDPLPEFRAELDKAASEIDKQCNAWASAAKGALDGILTTDEEGLLNALRGHTRAQEASIEYKFRELGGGSLRRRMADDHDRPIGGLNDKQYEAALAYLAGDVVAGAKAELASTVHWYGGEGQHAENIMRALTLEQQTEVGDDPVARRVHDSLSGTDLKVFDALTQGKNAQADAYRVIEKMDEARRAGETEDQIKAIRQFTGGANQAAAKQHLEEVQREFAGIRGIVDAKTGKPVTQAEAAKAFADYAVEDKQVEVPDPDGGISTYTAKLNKADAMLVRTAAQFGVDSPQGKAARVLHEAVREDDKPNLEELERATVDPRLNPALTPKPTVAQQKQAKAERDEIFQTAAAMGGEFGFAKVPNARAAKDLFADKLRQRYDLTDEKGKVGADYVESLVQKDVPDAAAGLRYAMLGAGTDEDLIHRNLQRLSRQDVERVRGEYQDKYHSDLYADLGVYGQGSFGELSGDDRLKAEVELMGVPQNDREMAEVARYRQMQQRNETGAVGKFLNEGSGEDLALSRAERRLQDLIGGTITTDKFGRPVIDSDRFDKKTGDYVGPNKDAFTVEVNFAQTVAENYSASIDRITNFITSAIAILGAVVATVVTGGAGAPLLAAAIAGASGLLAMGASYAIKGGRYGWEQALTDLGMTVVQMVTAGVGQSLGAAAKGGMAAAEAAEAVEVAEGAGATAAKTMGAVESAGKSGVTGALENVAEKGGSKFGQMIKVGAATGGIGGAGGVALDEHTWDKGVGTGLGRVFLGGTRGVFTGVLSSAITGGIERIPVGGSTLGEVLQSTAGPAVSGGLLAGAGGMAGRVGEVGFDAATGRFHGNLHDAMSSVAEGGAQPLLQGFLEGAVRGPHPPPHDVREGQQAAAAGVEHQTAPPAPHPAGGDPQRPAASVHEHETPTTPPTPTPTASPAPEHVPPAPTPEIAGPPAGAGGGRGPGPFGPPRAPAGGEPLFPGLSDAEMDALSMRSGPFVQVGTSEDIGLRIPKGQPATPSDRAGYFGIDPATGMTVQEYSFLAKRGMPALDSAGNPVAASKAGIPAVDAAGNPIVGPKADKKTYLRLHSPDPNAPAGSASREGWTINIEQGNARMTPDGKWFDTRFSTLPDGSRFDTRPYRRGPAGEWLDASDRPVTEPSHLAALDTWDQNMAASHIPMFPEAPPPAPPAPATPTEQPPAGSPGRKVQGEAAPVSGSSFHAGGRGLVAVEGRLVVQTDAEAVRAAIDQALPRVTRETVELENGKPVITVLAGGRSVRVLIETEPPPDLVEARTRPVARFDQNSDGTYTIRFSEGARDEHIERALAHELAEIRSIESGGRTTGPHALEPGSKATELSAHDLGRIAELEVITRQINEAEPGSETAASVLSDGEALVTHLGLVYGGEAAEERLNLVKRYLAASEQQRAMVEDLITGAQRNKLPPPPGTESTLAETKPVRNLFQAELPEPESVRSSPGPDRVWVTDAIPGQPTSGTIHVVREGEEMTFARTNRTLNENVEKRGYLSWKQGGILLSVDEMKGLRVLDLAAGTEGLTVNDLRRLGIEAFGIDIALSDQAETAFLRRADLARGVPFEGSFDIAFELYGGLAYGLAERQPAAVANALQHLRPGGTLYLVPLSESVCPVLERLIHDAGGAIEKRAYFSDEVWRIRLPSGGVGGKR